MIARAAGTASALMTLSACGQTDAPLIAPALIEGDAIPAPLAPQAGDPARGRVIFTARERGHCVICHQLDAVDAPFQGDVGPALHDVADRLSPAQIRLRIAAPAAVWPDTIMPSYYQVAGLTQVAPEFQGRPLLTAQEIEDVVAFLSDPRAGSADNAP